MSKPGEAVALPGPGISTTCVVANPDLRTHGIRIPARDAHFSHKVKVPRANHPRGFHFLARPAGFEPVAFGFPDLRILNRIVPGRRRLRSARHQTRIRPSSKTARCDLRLKNPMRPIGKVRLQKGLASRHGKPCPGRVGLVNPPLGPTPVHSRPIKDASWTQLIGVAESQSQQPATLQGRSGGSPRASRRWPAPSTRWWSSCRMWGA